MNLIPPSLKRGDTIAIISPAKAIEKAAIEYAQTVFENAGFKVLIGKHTLTKHHYFAGTDLERLSDFQEMLDHPDVKAIVCARGGYGAVRIVDKIQWASQLRNPKWIVGFSDITVFHQKMQRFGIQSIHATMPLNFESNSLESFTSLFSALKGESYEITCSSASKNKLGKVSGDLIGGNLSIVYSLIGTDDQPNYRDAILFIEDVGEQLYAIDRMFHSLKKAGILDQIKGLIVGGMTNMKETETPTGFILEDLILEHFEYSNIPICFDFPAGHIDDNRALIFGKTIELTIEKTTTSVRFQ